MIINMRHICTKNLAMCLIIAKGRSSHYATLPLAPIMRRTRKVGVKLKMHKHFSITQHNSIISRVAQNKIISAIFNRNIIIAMGQTKNPRD